MQRKNVGFEQLSDIMAFRVVVADVARVLPRARRRCTAAIRCVPGRFKDYISTPKPNGYRSLHTGVIGPERPAHRSADPHRAKCTRSPSSASPRTGPTSRAAPSTDGRQYRWLRELLDILEHAAGRRGIPRAHQARDVPGPGLLLHAEGRSDRAAARRHAGRLRLCRALPGRRHLRRRQDQRPHGAAAHAAAKRRPGRDHHRPRRRRRRRPGSGSSSPARRAPRIRRFIAHAAAPAISSSSAVDPATRPSGRKATSSPRRRSRAC